jgi:hypothetical protein
MDRLPPWINDYSQLDDENLLTVNPPGFDNVLINNLFFPALPANRLFPANERKPGS